MIDDVVDIEVYVRTGDIDAIVALLSESIGLLETDSISESGIRLYRNSGVSVVIQPSEDGFLSIWLRGKLPWRTSLEFGRYVAQRLPRSVRCDPGTEFQQVSPLSAIFLQIEAGRESLVDWS